MKRIVLPGVGTPQTITVQEDSTLGVLVNGKRVNLDLQAGVPVRIEFLGGISPVGLVA